VKKIVLWICMVWMLVLALPAAASGTYVTDNAGLLPADALAQLEENAAMYFSDTGIGLVILTEDGIGGENPFQYAADFYDYGGYPEDGVILFLDMAERDWCIVTSGSCMDLIDDREIEMIGSAMVPLLSEGLYAAGFETFQQEAMYRLSEEYVYSDAYVYDDEYVYNTNQDYYSEPVSVSQCILTGGFFGLVIALIVCLVLKAQMNTAKPQFAAGYYLVENSFTLLQSRDRFLYSNVSKVARPKEQNHSSSNSSGGGFRSSSGRSHRGGGGKF